MDLITLQVSSLVCSSWHKSRLQSLAMVEEKDLRSALDRLSDFAERYLLSLVVLMDSSLYFVINFD